MVWFREYSSRRLNTCLNVPLIHFIGSISSPIDNHYTQAKLKAFILQKIASTVLCSCSVHCWLQPSILHEVGHLNMHGCILVFPTSYIVLRCKVMFRELHKIHRFLYSREEQDVSLLKASLLVTSFVHTIH